MKRLFSVVVLAMILAIILSTAGMLMSTAQAAGSEDLSVRQLLNPDGTLRLNKGYAGQLDVSGYNVRLDPVLGPVLSPLMSPYAWNALGSGLNGIVYAIAINGSDIYVGGQFSNADGNPNADSIAKWDGSTWSAVGHGVSGGFSGTVLAAKTASETAIPVRGTLVQANLRMLIGLARKH